jgi:hypothetical protein
MGFVYNDVFACDAPDRDGCVRSGASGNFEDNNSSKVALPPLIIH